MGPAIFTLLFACLPPARQTVTSESAPARSVLRVCADPNNLPFTNRRLEGFENRIAELLACELDRELEYVWRAQRRGFFRNAFGEDRCDVVLGVPAGFERALATRPYYRSSYVFVSRADRGLDLESLDDSRLADLVVGVQLVGDDGADTPPAHALARRGIIDNVVGFTLYGDYRDENPPARIVDAVARGEIDVALVWGPLAGFQARREPAELALQPVTPPRDPGALRFAFSIAVGVDRRQPALRTEIDRVLAERASEIDEILAAYGVPRLPLEAGITPAGSPSASIRSAGADGELVR